MTTGRINQVTIVRRGDGRLPREGQKRYKVTVASGHKARGGAAAGPARARSSTNPHPLSPSAFPRAPSAGGQQAPERLETTA